jgi:tetratricopeptide (TPR) repeat protein
LRLAVEFFRESGDVDSELDILSSLRTFWDVQGHREEALHLLDDAVARGNEIRPEVEAQAWLAIAAVTPITDHARRRAAAERGLELHRALGEDRGAAVALVLLGQAALQAHDTDAAEDAFAEAASIGRSLGETQVEAGATSDLGLMALIQGDAARGREMSERALVAFRELEDDFGVAVALENLAIANLMVGDLERALAQGVSCVSAASALGSKPAIVYGLLVVGAIHAHSSRPVEGARLLGAAEAIRESIQEPELELLEARIHRDAVAAINDQLSPDEVADEWLRGRSMTVAEAVEYVRASGDTD